MRFLFVCSGNICRSPTAEAVFRKRAADAGLSTFIDSAGTGAWHAGEKPDTRARAAGERRGYDFRGQAARAVTLKDFGDFDYILAMDNANLKALTAQCPPRYAHKIRLFLNYADDVGVSEVPDPYYGGADGFERVIDLIEAASDGLIKDIIS